MKILRLALTSTVLGLLTLAACSDDGGSGSSSSSSGSSSGASSGTPPGSTTDAGNVPGAPGDAGADSSLPASGGIELTADGTTYVLDTNPNAAQSGNGWLIGAAKIDGATMRNLAIILNRADGPGPSYVPLTPGEYPCTTPGAPPFSWARFQYATPGGTTYQSPSSATCSVTLTEFGDVGGRLKGSFSASLDRIVGSEATPVAISGTFDVERKN